MARALNLAAQYRDMGVGPERVLMRIPGSWEGIQAAKELEAQGIATHIILIYRYDTNILPLINFHQGAEYHQCFVGQLEIAPNADDWISMTPQALRLPGEDVVPMMPYVCICASLNNAGCSVCQLKSISCSFVLS